MKSNPMVSIVIPLYNGSNYVEEAIRSAISQTYSNVEIIVVNDGSTDEGAGKRICEKYADRIRYVEKENGGCASALNYGIHLAQGEYISWLSHDDLYLPCKVERQIQIYEKYNLDRENTIISNPARLINADGEMIMHPGRKVRGLRTAQKAFRYLLFGACPNGCGLLIPKACFEKAGGFEEDLRFVLDWNLWLKFAISGVDFFFEEEKLVCNRMHSMQVTAKQKQLHSIEANRTVDQLFHQLCTMDDKTAYLKDLYRFAFGCKRGDQKAIRAYLRSNKIPVNYLKCIYTRLYVEVKRCAKAIYHRIR